MVNIHKKIKQKEVKVNMYLAEAVRVFFWLLSAVVFLLVVAVGFLRFASFEQVVNMIDRLAKIGSKFKRHKNPQATIKAS
jgi:hypothetical protein